MPEPIIDLLPADRPQPPRTNRAQKEEDDGPAFSSFLNEEQPAANDAAAPAAAEKPADNAETGGKTSTSDGEARQATAEASPSDGATPKTADEKQSATGNTTADSAPAKAVSDILLQNAAAGVANAATGTQTAATGTQTTAGNTAIASSQPNVAQQGAAAQRTPQGAAARTAPAEAAGQPKLAARDTRQPIITPPQAPQVVPKAPSAIVPDEIPETDVSEIRIDLAGRKKSTATSQSALLGEGLATKPVKQVAATGETKSGAQAALASLMQTPEAQAATPRGAQDPNALQLTRPPDAAQPVTSQPVDTAQALPTTQQTATPQINAASATNQASFAQQMAQSATPQPAQQLGVSIVRAAREGMDRIDIQLHPAELGRVEVKMELGHDGRLIAVVSAERADTLEQLRRDINQLERALADAGFDTDGDSFRFDDGNTPGGDDGESSHQFAGGDDTVQIPDASLASRQLLSSRIGVDISV